jgi:hypothetical protein
VLSYAPQSRSLAGYAALFRIRSRSETAVAPAQVFLRKKFQAKNYLESFRPLDRIYTQNEIKEKKITKYLGI